MRMWKELIVTDNSDKQGTFEKRGPNFKVAFVGVDGKHYVHHMYIDNYAVMSMRDRILTNGFTVEIGEDFYDVMPGAVLGMKYYDN